MVQDDDHKPHKSGSTVTAGLRDVSSKSDSPKVAFCSKLYSKFLWPLHGPLFYAVILYLPPSFLPLFILLMSFSLCFQIQFVEDVFVFIHFPFSLVSAIAFFQHEYYMINSRREVYGALILQCRDLVCAYKNVPVDFIRHLDEDLVLLQEMIQWRPIVQPETHPDRVWTPKVMIGRSRNFGRALYDFTAGGDEEVINFLDIRP